MAEYGLFFIITLLNDIIIRGCLPTISRDIVIYTYVFQGQNVFAKKFAE